MTSFSTLKLNPSLKENLTSLKYLSMTEIQAEALPLILSGENVVGQAKTGSGKTAAFVLGILEKLKVKQFRVQALILCPTRELADQVAKETRKLARSIHNIKVLTLCGGKPFGPQLGSLEHGAHIIVGTPGRVEEHLRKGSLKVTSLNTLVLDEADRMLDMGFQASLDAILGHLPDERQTLLFSATYPPQIQKLTNRLMKNPIIVEAKASHDETSIQQSLYLVEENMSRIDALENLLLHYQAQSTLVFCNTKIETLEVADALNERGFTCLALNGDLEQRIRDQTLVRFSNNSISILVATDVAARGLDIDLVDAVFNYHIPRELEVHVHRVGRTGRAGKSGIACTLFEQKDEYKLNKLEEYLKQEIPRLEINVRALSAKNIVDPQMSTLQIDGGRKQKVRPGDILGALTSSKEIAGSDIGKIDIFDNNAYIAVRHEKATLALKTIENGKLKGRSFRVRRIRG